MSKTESESGKIHPAVKIIISSVGQYLDSEHISGSGKIN